MALLICAVSFSQNGINYKALIKDTNGNVLANQSISILASLEITANAVIYREEHTISTDNNGIAIIVIGTGVVQTGNFNAINWKVETPDLNIQVDIGNGYVDFGVTEFQTVPYAINTLKPEGLEAIDEGNGIGWRLAGSNPDFFGPIGLNAVDLSFNNQSITVTGATGERSLAFGGASRAIGDNSISLGLQARATQPNSIAIGYLANSSGSLAVAIGPSIASGNSAIAMGSATESSGYASFSSGENTIASGDHSSALGRGTRAEASNSTAVGRYNVGGGNASVWTNFDPLFEIGNGFSNSSRRNALTVFQSGQHSINSSSIGLYVQAQNFGVYISDSGNDGIYITDPGDDGMSIVNPGFNGISISNAEADGIVITNAQSDGIVASATNRGAFFSGGDVGVFATASNNNNPDIILGGDEGIISSSSSTNSSLVLSSNNSVTVELDNDTGNNSFFIIRNGFSPAFYVDEIGNTNINGELTIGNEIIEDGGSDILAFSSSIVPLVDGDDRLGGPNRRWQDVWALDGTINTSDRREKKNIKDLNYGLAEILQMQPVRFNWKNKNIPDTKLGLIAQDLQKLIPEVVKSHIWEKNETTGALTKKNLDRLGVYYSDLVPVLIKAIQEQQEQIISLKTTIQDKDQALNHQENINNKQSEVLEALLSRVETLEQSNN